MSHSDFNSAENKATRQRYLVDRAIRARRMPDAELYSWATELWRRKVHAPYDSRPAVRVFKKGQQCTIVLRAGGYHISAYSWRRLAEQVVLGQWRRFMSGRLYYRRWK